MAAGPEDLIQIINSAIGRFSKTGVKKDDKGLPTLRQRHWKLCHRRSAHPVRPVARAVHSNGAGSEFPTAQQLLRGVDIERRDVCGRLEELGTGRLTGRICRERKLGGFPASGLR